MRQPRSIRFHLSLVFIFFFLLIFFLGMLSIARLRDFNNVYDLSWKVRYYDAEGAHLRDEELSFDPRYQVKKGQRLHVSVFLDDELARLARRMVRIDSGQRKFAAADQAPAPKDPDQLPRQVLWDLKQLREHFTILKTGYDPLDNQVVWLVEARRAAAPCRDLS